MSRLLRKGAVIGKAAMVFVIAGLLLYGAATLLKADLHGEKPTSQVAACDYLASAEAAISAGDVQLAYDTTARMMTQLSPSPESGQVAQQIAAKLVNAHRTELARDMYLYAAKYATGNVLKKSLCGLAETDAVKGDGKAAYEAVVRLGNEFAGDDNAVKTINRVGDRYLRSGFNIRSFDVYRVAAEKWAGTEQGMNALGAMGMAGLMAGDRSGAVKIAERLQDEYPANEQANRLAIRIAHKLAERAQCTEALQIYDSLNAKSPSDHTKRDIAVGQAVMAILEGKREEADVAINSLKTSASPNAWVCFEIANAYYDAERFQESAATFQKMVDLSENASVAWGYKGKIAECWVRSGNDALALEASERLITDCPEKGAGKAIFDIAVVCVKTGRFDLAQEILVRSAKLCTAEAERMWIDAAQAGLAISRDPTADVTAIVTSFAAGRDPSPLPDLSGPCFEIAYMCHRSGIREWMVSEIPASRATFLRAQQAFQFVIDNMGESEYAPEAWYWSARGFMRAGEYVKGAEYARKFVDMWPNNKNSWAGHRVMLDCYDKLLRDCGGTNRALILKVVQVSQEIKAKYPDRPQLSRIAEARISRYGAVPGEGGAL
jgi:tetratricopeptide (TPR) repeat protein